MIHYLDVDIKGRDVLQVRTPDTPNPHPEEANWADETIKSLELTVDQHYGLKLETNPDGIVMVQLREAAGWTTPIYFADLVRTLFKQDSIHFGSEDAQ